MCECVHAQSLSHVQLFVTPWTVACQVPLSMGFSRQEYWSGLPCPPSGASQPRDHTLISYISCIGRWVLYHWCHLGSSKVSPLAFKAKCLGPCLPGPGPLVWGAQCRAQTTCSLKRTSSAVIILFVGHHPRGIGLDYMPFLHFYLSCCASSFLSLVVEDLFC